MSLLQTTCLFVSGYVLSRLVLRAGLHRLFVDALLRASGGRVSRVVLALMLLSFGLSTVAPNALTVLALLPVLTRLRSLVGSEDETRLVGTVLVMGLIYGANIGGVGSLLGSPANLYLLLNLEIYRVPDASALHFVSWLTFGVPMGLALLVLCWGVIWAMSPRTMAARLRAPAPEPASGPARPPLFASARRWALLWFGAWTALLAVGVALGLHGPPGAPPTPAVLSGSLGGRRYAMDVLDLVALGFTVAFTAVVLIRRVRTAEGRLRLLPARDLVRELPVKGVAVAVAVVLLLVAVAHSGAVDWLRQTVPALLPRADSPFVTGLVLVLVTILATELLSNTTVSTVLFPLGAVAAPSFGADPLMVMLGVSLASTCAFMSPVATPVNALALSSLGHLSWRRFVWTGLWANLVAALWIALWITWIIPPVLDLFRP